MCLILMSFYHGAQFDARMQLVLRGHRLGRNILRPGDSDSPALPQSRRVDRVWLRVMLPPRTERDWINEF